jgi:LTXXQ motif family protein
MFKPVIAATAMLAIAGSSIVYAQERFGDHRGFEGGSGAEYHHRLTADDIAAFADARIAALRAGLELTPDQAKNWPPFEHALRDLAQLRIQRMQAREAADQQAETSQQGEVPTNPFARLARRADNMAKTSAALKRLSDTGAPLYQSLSDAQKHRFRFLAHMLRPHWMAGGAWQRGEFGREGRGGPGGYFEHRNGGPYGMTGRDEDDGGANGMIGRDRDQGGWHGMMGHDQDEDPDNL